jgi:hypothetical protein
MHTYKVRLNHAVRACNERKGTGGAFEPMNRTARREYEDATHILSLMKLMVEGHYLPLQDLLRCQPKRDADINLIEIVNKLFTMQADTTRTLVPYIYPFMNVYLVATCLFFSFFSNKYTSTYTLCL